jgi:hypothetical protein
VRGSWLTTFASKNGIVKDFTRKLTRLQPDGEPTMRSAITTRRSFVNKWFAALSARI